MPDRIITVWAWRGWRGSAEQSWEKLKHCSCRNTDNTVTSHASSKPPPPQLHKLLAHSQQHMRKFTRYQRNITSLSHHPESWGMRYFLISGSFDDLILLEMSLTPNEGFGVWLCPLLRNPQLSAFCPPFLQSLLLQPKYFLSLRLQ